MFLSKTNFLFIKNLFLGFVFASTLTGLSTSSQAFGLAIKLDLTPHAKTLIIPAIIDAANFTTPTDKKNIVKIPHITIGYVDGIPTLKDANQIGDAVKNFIDQYLTTNPIKFEIDTCDNFSGKTKSFTVLTPTSSSDTALNSLNAALQNYLSTLNINGFNPSLNTLTQPGSFLPHLTLINNSTGPARLTAMKVVLTKLKRPGQSNVSFNLLTSSYSAK